MSDTTAEQQPAPSEQQRAARAEPVHRVFGLGRDDDGAPVLRIVRTVGKREALVAVPVEPADLARLVEDAGSLLREHLSGVNRR